METVEQGRGVGLQLAGRAVPVEGLVFDFDGVLVDSDELHWRAYRRAFAAEGIVFSLAEYVSGAKGRARAAVIERFGPDLDDAARTRVAQAKTDEAHRLVTAGLLEPVAGAVAFVRAVRDRGLRCGVASTSVIAPVALQQMGIAGLFDCICAKGPGDRAKPHPDIFLRAFSLLDRSAARCLVVEDTVVGARAALRAGAPVVIRGGESEWRDEPMRSALEGFFSDYPELHRRLGWGALAEEAA